MIYIHPTAEVSKNAHIGERTKIWHHAQIREHARLGNSCIIAKGVYIDHDVIVGNNCKIGNYVSIYVGVTIEDGVFVGPHVCFANDKVPRAVTPKEKPKGVKDWVVTKTVVKRGASVGAGSVIVPGVTIGEWAMIGAGSVVTRDVARHSLVYGNPARAHGYVCLCGAKLVKKGVGQMCPVCKAEISI
ncbi:N-acetyltransferase [Candidatus Gottesmanbacteria bacterium]|nr:N-acetyltransferase [Candidatus Gottesmanbacteria bacterium]